MTIMTLLDEKYDQMTKSQKKLADFVRQNLVNITFMTITDLSQQSLTSTATITRFVKSLGYSSFSEFQNEIQELAKKEISPVKEFRYWVVNDKPSKNVLYDEIQEAKSALDNLYSEETYDTLVAASKSITQARNVYVLGSRSSFSMAYLCYHFLKRVKENIILLENRNDDVTLPLQYVTKYDMVIVIGYPKYTQFSLNIMQFFKDLGCKILAITDSQGSPLAKADYVIIAKNRLKIYFITTLTIINSLIVLVSRMDPKANTRLFEEENAVTKKLNIYHE